MPGQHVDFVYQIDFVRTVRGGVLDIFQQVASVFDLGTRGGIDFNQINKTALIQTLTHGAGATRIEILTLLTIESLGQNTGQSGFAYTACSGEQVGVVHPVELQGVGEGTNDVLLSNDFTEIAGAPFTGQSLVRHGVHTGDQIEPESKRVASYAGHTPAHESTATAASSRT